MNNSIILFDVDGTLTPARREIKEEMINTLKEIKEKNYTIGFVGGSDLSKQKEQLGEENLKLFDFMFPENGLVAYKNQELFHENSIEKFFDEETLQEFINFMLSKLSQIKLPRKRGTFIEFRTGLINLAPVGRNANQDARDEFEEYDKIHNIRKKLIDDIKKQFPNLDLHYSIGGQISIDIFPKGWDKTYCLKHIKDYNKIYFFGDKTYEGGNDFEIYNHEKVKGFSVNSYEDIIKILKENFL